MRTGAADSRRLAVGRLRAVRLAPREPEPGRVIMEENRDGSGGTTITVEKAGGGASAEVTIATEPASRPVVAGDGERFVLSWTLPRVYRKELEQPSEYPPGPCRDSRAIAREDPERASGPGDEKMNWSRVIGGPA
jgi:hypothetical protein